MTKLTENKRAGKGLEDDINKPQKVDDHVEAYKGLWCICAKCVKIRDNNGYWRQIEGFYENHSKTSFSHGLCQECMEKLYGHKDWYNK